MFKIGDVVENVNEPGIHYELVEIHSSLKGVPVFKACIIKTQSPEWYSAQGYEPDKLGDIRNISLPFLEGAHTKVND